LVAWPRAVIDRLWWRRGRRSHRVPRRREWVVGTICRACGVSEAQEWVEGRMGLSWNRATVRWEAIWRAVAEERTVHDVGDSKECAALE
jgi:hypothetical protein